MNKLITDKTFDEERALYHLTDTHVLRCVFGGPADGESAFKEARNIEISECHFLLRYPFWHTHSFRIAQSGFEETARAPIWYSTDGNLSHTTINGVKCLRECENITMTYCTVHSPEFGWRCRGLTFCKCDMESEYFLFESKHININHLSFYGKYSFQYTEDVIIRNSDLDTKDAFWHGKNITVYDSVIKGEYLAWYSDGLTLVNCKIIGTQPFCYCKNLRLINCTMEDTDLAFEYSDVQAELNGHILSVKNPASGWIHADSIGDVILDDSVYDSNCSIVIRNA